MIAGVSCQHGVDWTTIHGPCKKPLRLSERCLPWGTVRALLTKAAVLPSRLTSNRKGGVAEEASFRNGATAPTKSIGNTRENVCWVCNTRRHRQDCRINGFSGRWTSHHRTYINIVRIARTTGFRVAGHHIIVVWNRAIIFVPGSLSMDRTGELPHRPASHPNVNGKIVFASYYVANAGVLYNVRGQQERDELLQQYFVHTVCSKSSIVVAL